jgi:hypothetical protein
MRWERERNNPDRGDPRHNIIKTQHTHPLVHYPLSIVHYPWIHQSRLMDVLVVVSLLFVVALIGGCYIICKKNKNTKQR